MLTSVQHISPPFPSKRLSFDLGVYVKNVFALSQMIMNALLYLTLTYSLIHWHCILLCNLFTNCIISTTNQRNLSLFYQLKQLLFLVHKMNFNIKLKTILYFLYFPYSSPLFTFLVYFRDLIYFIRFSKYH